MLPGTKTLRLLSVPIISKIISDMKVLHQLQTERLELRPPTAKDIPNIIQYAGDRRISDMVLNIPHPYDEQDAIFWINLNNQDRKHNLGHTFGIFLQGSDEMIGAIGIKINLEHNRGALGYWLAVPHWNKGYMTEAAKAMLDFGFHHLKINKILATHLVENPASGQVMIKNGMIKEGVLKDHFKKGDTYLSVVQYRLTKAEYLNL